jgi:parvulin-like peptidyl-prolyl isomerase
MKKLKDKLTRRRAEMDEENSPSRITNQTVAEHREQILAGGRKFKYPVQYAKHKLVLNTVFLGIGTAVLLIIAAWWQLYYAQNTSNFMYRITQLIPVQVAKVDGEGVRYSEYLKKYRSSVHYLQQQNNLNLKTADGKRQAQYIKQRSIESVEEDAYAMKLARKNKVSVSNKEVDEFIKRELDAKKVSLAAFEKTVLRSFYDWSIDDYKSVVRIQLLKRKLDFKIDKDALKEITTLRTQAITGGDFGALATANSDDETTKASGGDSTSLPLDNQDPNGLISEALKLEAGKVSKVIEGTDGYYIVKLVEKNDSTIRYQLIKVALDEFSKRFEAVKKADKIKEFIKIEKQ